MPACSQSRPKSPLRNPEGCAQAGGGEGEDGISWQGVYVYAGCHWRFPSLLSALRVHLQSILAFCPMDTLVAFAILALCVVGLGYILVG